jgi:hypothetical protein
MTKISNKEQPILIAGLPQVFQNRTTAISFSSCFQNTLHLLRGFIHKLLADQYKTQIVKSSTAILALKILGAGIGYIFILVLSRIFGSQERVPISLSMTILSILVMVGSLFL